MPDSDAATTMDIGSYEDEYSNLTKQLEGKFELILEDAKFYEYDGTRKDGQEFHVEGINWRFKTTNADDPDNNDFTVFHRTGWGTFYMKSTIAALRQPGDGPAQLDPEALKLDQDEFINSLKGRAVVAKLKKDSYDDRKTGEKKTNTIIADFVLVKPEGIEADDEER
jgi:hypothetical protein